MRERLRCGVRASPADGPGAFQEPDPVTGSVDATGRWGVLPFRSPSTGTNPAAAGLPPMGPVQALVSYGKHRVRFRGAAIRCLAGISSILGQDFVRLDETAAA
jgi:hypothetical protein